MDQVSSSCVFPCAEASRDRKQAVSHGMPARTRAFDVTVHLDNVGLRYAAIGTDSASVHMDALDRFGACGVSVKPQARAASTGGTR